MKMLHLINVYPLMPVITNCFVLTLLSPSHGCRQVNSVAAKYSHWLRMPIGNLLNLPQLLSSRLIRHFVNSRPGLKIMCYIERFAAFTMQELGMTGPQSFVIEMRLR